MEAAKLNSSLKDIREESTRVAAALADRATESAKRASAEVDGAAHRFPWYFVGATALVMGLAGFAAGRWTKNEG